MATAMQNFVNTLQAARMVSTPIVVIRGPDAASTIRTFQSAVLADEEECRLVQWDAMRGLMAVNNPGKEVASQPGSHIHPTEVLEAAQKFPEDTVLFFSNAHRFFEDTNCLQGIYNLRDQFKRNYRMLVLLTPRGSQVPAEIADHVLILDEPLPAEQDFHALSLKMVEAAQAVHPEFPSPSEEEIGKIVNALIGLPRFPGEEALALSLSRTGVDLPRLWERKVQAIEQIPGLSVWKGKESFADIGGVENAKNFLRAVLNGSRRYRAIVFIDEVEKAFAGTGSDSSGVMTQMTGTILSWTQDHDADGCIFVGPTGTAKTALAKAAGNEAGIPTISFDVSAMQGKHVGESGEKLRAALDVIDAVSQGQALFIVTSNKLDSLPPELLRRFSLVTMFFDIPSRSEKDLIWDIYMRQFALKGPHPDDADWTGADIRNCCRSAHLMNISLTQTLDFFAPIGVSRKEQIKALRVAASGQFVSAATPGVYVYDDGTTAPPDGAERTIRFSRRNAPA